MGSQWREANRRDVSSVDSCQHLNCCSLDQLELFGELLGNHYFRFSSAQGYAEYEYAGDGSMRGLISTCQKFPWFLQCRCWCLFSFSETFTPLPLINFGGLS